MERNWHLWSALSIIALVGVAGNARAGVKAGPRAHFPSRVVIRPLKRTTQPLRPVRPFTRIAIPQPPFRPWSDLGPNGARRPLLSRADEVVLKVKNALLAARPPIDLRFVNVAAAHGLIRLDGSVPTPAQKIQSTEAARSVAGGSIVVNYLVVRGR